MLGGGVVWVIHNNKINVEMGQITGTFTLFIILGSECSMYHWDSNCEHLRLRDTVS